MLYLLILWQIEYFLRLFWLYNNKTPEKMYSRDCLNIKPNGIVNTK